VNADFSGSGLRFADASGTDVSNSNLSDVYAPFFIGLTINGRPTVFKGAKMRGANFLAADLRGADFRSADLSGAAFPFADLRDADLRGANLSGAHFTGALLIGAKLEGATFDQTNMAAAILNASSISGAQRQGTCGHQTKGRTQIQIEILERWPSNRFASGYEYENLTNYMEFPDIPSLGDPSLPMCTSKADSAAGFSADHPSYEKIFLERGHLEKAGREANVIKRLREFSERVGAAQAAGPRFARD
jgi:hypothetical protein